MFGLLNIFSFWGAWVLTANRLISLQWFYMSVYCHIMDLLLSGDDKTCVTSAICGRVPSSQQYAKTTFHPHYTLLSQSLLCVAMNTTLVPAPHPNLHSSNFSWLNLKPVINTEYRQRKVLLDLLLERAWHLSRQSVFTLLSNWVFRLEERWMGCCNGGCQLLLFSADMTICTYSCEFRYYFIIFMVKHSPWLYFGICYRCGLYHTIPSQPL